jgi:carbamoyl-phosphate synthase large subunit
VLSTSQWAAPPTARSLARAGFRVVGAWEGGRLTGRTRYCRTMHELPPSAEPAEFVAAVEQICRDEDISAVVPLADEMLGALLHGASPDVPWKLVGPDRERFGRLCDKAGLRATAAAADIASPATSVVTVDGMEGERPPFPVYVKTLGGAVKGVPAGRPVRVTDEQSLDEAVGHLVAAGRSALIQEEVDGAQWRFHFVRHEGRTAHLAARTLGDYPFRVGQSTISYFTVTPPPLEEVGMRLIEHAGFEGAGSLQFVERGGVWYVHDANLRMPASVGGTIAAGLDMPRLAVEVALGTASPVKPVTVRPVKIVQLPGEVEALRDALGHRAGGRSAVSVLGGMARAAVMPHQRLIPFDPTDPLPTLAALALIRPSARRG